MPDPVVGDDQIIMATKSGDSTESVWAKLAYQRLQTLLGVITQGVSCTTGQNVSIFITEVVERE